MAGVMMTGDEGREVKTEMVPEIGGGDGGGNSKVVESEHLDDHHRNEGVSYNENPGVDSDGMGSGFPAGTDVGEANNPLKA